MSAQFKTGLFSCFDNCGLCVITYFLPCYTFGKNQERLGEDCLLCGVAYAFYPLNVVFQFIARGKIREQGNIEGSAVGDFFTVFCCGPCALCQEAVELDSMPGTTSQGAPGQPVDMTRA